MMDAEAEQSGTDASGDLGSDERENATDGTASQSSGRVTSEDAGPVADATVDSGSLDAALPMDAATDAEPALSGE
jgi:hypothetical protein